MGSADTGRPPSYVAQIVRDERGEGTIVGKMVHLPKGPEPPLLTAKEIAKLHQLRDEILGAQELDAGRMEQTAASNALALMGHPHRYTAGFGLKMMTRILALKNQRDATAVKARSMRLREEEAERAQKKLEAGRGSHRSGLLLGPGRERRAKEG